jgi:hypothetical protein
LFPWLQGIIIGVHGEEKKKIPVIQIYQPEVYTIFLPERLGGPRALSERNEAESGGLSSTGLHKPHI